MSTDEINDLIYFPNGEINASFVLSNANLLMKEGELEAAISLFRSLKEHKRMGHCGHYGVGQCYLKMGQPEQAALAFEKALSQGSRPYIAAALLDALQACGDFEALENRALEFAKTYATESGYVDLFRAKYHECILRNRLKSSP